MLTFFENAKLGQFCKPMLRAPLQDVWKRLQSGLQAVHQLARPAKVDHQHGQWAVSKDQAVEQGTGKEGGTLKILNELNTSAKVSCQDPAQSAFVPDPNPPQSVLHFEGDLDQ